MSYEQKRLTVRVYLPGPPEKVVDWEAVAREMLRQLGRASCIVDAGNEFDRAVKRNCTERPSRIDTGVDVVIKNGGESGLVWALFESPGGHLKCPDQIAALGFPTEPQTVVETKAEGEASA